MRNPIPYLAVLLLTLGASCKKELSASGSPLTVTLQFTDVVGNSPLQLYSSSYQDPFGEVFQVDTFQYYISDIQLISVNGSLQNIPGIAQLVDAADSSSLSISFPAKGDSVVAISFTFGINNADDPSATLSGTSGASTAPGNIFDYSLTGISGPNGVLRTVTLPLPAPITAQPIFPDTAYVAVSVNLDNWFSSVNALPISTYNTCLTPGALASQYASNAAKMFSVTNVIVQ